MAGHITKRSDGSYSVVVDLGRDPSTGRRRQLWRTSRGTKRDAEALLVQLLHERNTGMDIQPGRTNLATFMTHWLETYARHNVGARTFERYQSIIQKHLIPALGSILLAKLRPQHVQAYYSAALQGGRADGRAGGLTAQTVLHHHRLLRELLHHAVKWQVIARNPVDAAEPPRPVRTEMHVLDPDGVSCLLIGCTDAEMRALILAAIGTGMRQSELLGLRWSDVDLGASRLQVTRSLQYITGQGLSFTEPKTDRSRRRLALSRETVTALLDHRRRQAEQRLAAGPAYGAEGLVFADPLGQPLPPFRISHRFNTLVKRLGLAPLRFHDLRHTHATLLLKAGVHPKVVSERLGHASVSITLDTYSHVLPGLQEEAAGLLDQFLAPRPTAVG